MTHAHRAIAFTLGSTTLEGSLNTTLAAVGDPLVSYLRRHATGDYGAIQTERSCANDRFVRLGQGVVRSSYPLRNGKKIQVVTVLAEGRGQRTRVLIPQA